MFNQVATQRPESSICISGTRVITYSGVQRHRMRGAYAHIQGSVVTKWGEYDHKIGGLSLLKPAPSNDLKLLKYINIKVVSKNTKGLKKL